MRANRKRSLARLALTSVFTANVVFFSPVFAAEPPPLDAQEEYKPILIDGEDLPVALGKSIDKLSLQAIIDGEMEPVPYQIDEYNTGGAVYFKEWKDVPIDGTEDVLDNNDKLLFLFKDAGARRDDTQVSDGKIVAEVELTDDAGIKRYVYLVEGSRLRSEEQYVRYSTDVGQVETDFYQLVYNKENQVNWDDFSYTSFKGERPLDSMKIRLVGGLFTDLSQVTLNNNNLIAKPKGERVGPVRTTSQLELKLWLFNIPIMNMSYQIHHYPKSMFYDVRVVMPEARRKIISNPRMAMSIDANKLTGSTLRTVHGPKQNAVVDGQLSPLENEMLKSNITPEQNWFWLSTQRDLDVVGFFNFLGGTREPISMVYNDDQNTENRPERFKGEIPAVGYSIDNFPMGGFFGFVVSVYLSDGFKGVPEQFTEDLRTLPTIRVFSSQS